MEKLKPSYQLADVKAALASPATLSITVSALRDAIALGFDRRGIVEVIQSMDQGMFVKSMTTYANHRVWQDVYTVPFDDLVLYVKFQAGIVTSFTVMSFKEK